MMDATLKPCPFCGGTAIAHSAIRDGREVFCSECRASARAYSPDALRKAIEAWNRRVTDPALLPDLHDALDAALNMVEGDGMPPDWDWLRQMRTIVANAMPARKAEGRTDQ